MATYGPKSYNLDINQLGASQFPRFAVNQESPYKDGIVVDIITDENHPQYDKEFGSNIGMVQVRIIPDDRGVPQEELNWAMPLESSIREYPLKNELVMLFYSVGRIFYTRRVNINNKITESSWPGLNDGFSYPPFTEINAETVVLASRGGPTYRPWGQSQSEKLGDEFAENPSVRMVRPMEGDTIIQGRYGNIVRFGSSIFSNPTASRPEPNLLLTVGQDFNRVTSTENISPYSLVYEDINKDKSCIWMVTDEKIDLRPATLGTISHLRSSEGSDSNSYTGAQIFINSDRVVINSKQNEISLFSRKEINLSAVQSITLDSNKTVSLTATKDIKLQADNDIFLKGKTLSFVSTGAPPFGDISFTASGNYVISGKKIFIGSDGVESQPLVLGGELALWLRSLLLLLSKDLVTAITTLNPTPYSIKIAELAKDLGGTNPKRARFNSSKNFTA